MVLSLQRKMKRNKCTLLLNGHTDIIAAIKVYQGLILIPRFHFIAFVCTTNDKSWMDAWERGYKVLCVSPAVEKMSFFSTAVKYM